ncbi:MAG: HigA family addiction module antitoxin [Phormidesmis sp.]
MTETCFNHLPLCDRPVPAAEVIKDMHMEDMSAAQLAEAISVSSSTISRMLSGKSALTPELAIKIAAHTGGAPAVWMRIETEYRLAIAQMETDTSHIKQHELLTA